MTLLAATEAETVTTSTTTKLSLKATQAMESIKADRKVKSDAEKRIKATMPIVEAEMKGFEVGTHRGITVTKRTHSHNTAVDLDLLLAAFPEAYAAVVTVNPYSYLR